MLWVRVEGACLELVRSDPLPLNGIAFEPVGELPNSPEAPAQGGSGSPSTRPARFELCQERGDFFEEEGRPQRPDKVSRAGGGRREWRTDGAVKVRTPAWFAWSDRPR